MPTYKTTGIVLRRHNLGEADRIVTFLTPDRGVLRAVARGVRRINSRQAGHLELFSEVGLMLAAGKNLDVITSARSLFYPDRLTNDYDRLQKAYLFAEMTAKLIPEDEPHEEAYELLKSTLYELNQDGKRASLELYFKLRLLSALGHKPELSACVNCGRADESLEYWFSPAHGGIVDNICRKGGEPPLSGTAIKLWRLIQTLEMAKIKSITGANQVAATSLIALERFYDHLFSARFKSDQLLRTHY